MSRELYQEGWGRRKNKYNNSCPCRNQIDADYYKDDKSNIEDVKEDTSECCEKSEIQYKTDIVEQHMNSNEIDRDESYDTREYEYNEMPFKKNKKKTAQYEEAKEAPYERMGQIKCCPFDAYGLNTYNSYYTNINVVKDHIEDLYIPFTVSITIPSGFIVPQGGCYEHNLAMDKHALSVNLMTQYYVYTDIDSYDCNSTEVVKMQIAVLNGPIYYNLTVENFVPAQPIQDVNQSPITYFSKRGSLATDKIIAYIPFGYEAPPFYTIDVVAEKETVTLPGGRCISKKTACEEYKSVLANPDIERVLNFSYVLVINSSSLS